MTRRGIVALSFALVSLAGTAVDAAAQAERGAEAAQSTGRDTSSSSGHSGAQAVVPAPAAASGASGQPSAGGENPVPSVKPGHQPNH